MLTNAQKAQAVVSALEDRCPRVLAHLAESEKLEGFLQERVQKFNLELAKRQRVDPKADDAVLEEGLMPMLVDFPASPRQKPLSPQQEKAVQAALRSYQESLPSPIIRH